MSERVPPAAPAGKNGTLQAGGEAKVSSSSLGAYSREPRQKSFWIVNIFLIAISIIVVLLGVIAVNNSVRVTDSPIYTDLNQQPAYARRGFDVKAIEKNDIDALLDLTQTRWEVVIPSDFNVPLRVSNILAPEEGDERVRFTPYDSIDNEFTILMPFELSAQTLAQLHGENPIFPGVHLSGIGENWEVYVNGKVVISEVHRDENGQVSSPRSLRDVVFPVDGALLQEGTNIIAFRIIGSYSSIDTGVIYSIDNYIGNYPDIIFNASTVMAIAFSLIYFFVGLYHLLLFIMRRSTWYNFTFCLYAILLAVYFLSRPSMFAVFTMDSAITQRIEYGSLYMLPFLLACFCEQLIIGKLRTPTRVYGIFAAILTLLQLISVDFGNDLLLVGQITSLIMVVYIVAFILSIPFVESVIKQKRETNKSYFALTIGNLFSTGNGNILIAALLVAATAVFDIYSAVIFENNYFVTQYSFFAFTVIAAIVLARHYANTFKYVNEANETLEAIVAARTVELEKQIFIAEEASRAKGDFLANMSHEIRTPINAIVGMTKIGRDSSSIEKKDYSFDKIKSASTHLLGIISDILDMSKIEEDRLELFDAEFDLRETIQNISSVLRMRAEEKALDFSVRIDESIPAVLLGDEQRLSQVVMHIFSNAIKFTHEGGSVSLDVSLAADEGTADESYMIDFRVSDTGIGMTEDQLDQLFNAFQQAESSITRNYGGTGLSLALSRRIAHLMGGDIVVTSSLGEGSTFIFSAQLKKAETDSLQKASNGEEVAIKEGEFEGRTILLVDDIEINREIVITLMETSGVIFVEAQNGKVAVQKFSEAPECFDAILMDLQMPIMDGYTATEIIRASDKPGAQTVPIIAMTANVFQEDIDKSLQVGMNAHLSKPVNIYDIAAELRKYW